MFEEITVPIVYINRKFGWGWSCQPTGQDAYSIETPTRPDVTGTINQCRQYADTDRTFKSIKSGGTFYNTAWFYDGKRIVATWAYGLLRSVDDLPLDRDNPQALVSFAQGVSSGITPFSERGAKEHGYSVQRFNELRDNLVKAGLAFWRDSNNKKMGLGLTRGGTALLRSVAQNPPADDYEPEGDDWAMSPEIVQK